MSKTEQPGESFPGLAYDRFEALVEALLHLLEAGEFMTFLSQGGSVRLLGDKSRLATIYAEKIGQDIVKADEADEGLAEVQHFLAAWVVLEDIAPLLRVLESHVFEEEFGALSEDAKEQFRTLLKDKAQLVSTKLYSAAVAERRARMQTAVGPLIEDLDVEVIQERQDALQGAQIKGPFLRFRLRYSDGAEREVFPSFPFGGGFFAKRAMKCFEFEGDETDIDLLLRRLRAAKDLLRRASAHRDD